MSQVITAIYEDGILKPEDRLDLPARTRVRLTVEPLEPNGAIPPDEEKARAELKRLTPSNAQLHELAKQFPPPPEWLDREEGNPPF